MRFTLNQISILKRFTMATDPVCKMQVDESKAAGKSQYGGKTYYFCSPACKTKFDANPSSYIKQG